MNNNNTNHNNHGIALAGNASAQQTITRTEIASAGTPLCVRETDSLSVDGAPHLVAEKRDSFGRSTGYTYAKDGVAQQTASTGYGTDGRIKNAGFEHDGEEKSFSYGYLSGSNLLQTLAMPNGVTLTQTYEAQRDLLTGMAYATATETLAQRSYAYDELGRPTSRKTIRNGSTANDTFARNFLSELASAQVNGTSYAYDYDNSGSSTFAAEDTGGGKARIIS